MMNSPMITGSHIFHAPVTFNISISAESSTPKKDIKSNLLAAESSTSKKDAVDMLYVKEAKEDKYEEHTGDDGIYQVVRRPKGRALVINNEFKTSPTYVRKGAGKDGVVMQQLWDGIGCDVVSKRDLTAEMILAAVKDFVKVTADFCVIVIMSHGKEDDFIIGDDKATTKVRKIVDEVVKSRELEGKPKLLFFQMCRGEQLTRTHTDTEPFATDESTWVMSLLNDLLPRGRILGTHVDDTDDFAEEYISDHPDTMLAFATQPNYKSFRNVDTGSWFIQSLAKVFAERAHEEDVVKMMQRVKEKMREYSAYAPGAAHHECVASVDGSYTFGSKRLYLFPGYPQTHKE